MNIAFIPDDIIGYWFTFLDNRDLLTWMRVMLACKKWMAIGKRVFNPGRENNRAIIWACRNGKLDCVKRLLCDRRVDPSANNNEAIISASENKYWNIVQELLKDPRTNPAANNNYLMEQAVV